MMEKSQKIRAFIAIPLPDFVKTPLQDLQRKFPQFGIKASFPKSKTLHLTLKFMGNIQPEDLGTIEKCMKKSVSGMLQYTLFSSGIGVFPSVKHPRVIWAGIKGETDILEKLVSELDRIFFKEMDIKREGGRFTPHLTLARIKEKIPPKNIVKLIKDFGSFRTPDFFITGISLFQSDLMPSGAIHREIIFTPFRY